MRPHLQEKNSRGLTLLEALVTMVLLGLVFAMVAALAHNFAEASATMGGSATVQAQLQVVQQVADQLGEAHQVDSPTPGQTTPAAFVGLDEYAPANEASGSPSSSGPLLTVRYALSAGQLIRTVTLPDGTHSSTAVARQLSGFSATYLTPHSIRVKASFFARDRLQSVAAVAYRWGG